MQPAPTRTGLTSVIVWADLQGTGLRVKMSTNARQTQIIATPMQTAQTLWVALPVPVIRGIRGTGLVVWILTSV